MKNTPMCLLLFISLAFSCTDGKIDIQSEFDDDQEMIVSHKLSDTTIYGTTFQRTYKVKFSENGDTARKGMYLNDFAFGKHFFYKDQGLYCIREFALADPYYIGLDAKNKSVDFSFWFTGSDSSFLNTVIYINENGDTIDDQSYFYRLKIIDDSKDSIGWEIEFFSASQQIQGYEMYLKPKDTTFVTYSSGLNNTLVVNLQKDEDEQYINCIIQTYAYQTNDTGMTGENGYDTRIIFIKEKIKSNTQQSRHPTDGTIDD